MGQGTSKTSKLERMYTKIFGISILKALHNIIAFTPTKYSLPAGKLNLCRNIFKNQEGKNDRTNS